MTEAANEIAQLASSHMWEGVGAWTTWKLLGPPALEVTEAARRWMAEKVGNSRAIVKKAAEIAGDDLQKPGRVHSRVAAMVFEEGSNVSDPVMQSYFAGMLAAGRTEDGADDRAAYYLRVLAGLTADQVAVHYAVYSELAECTWPEGSSMADVSVAEHLTIKVQLADAARVLAVQRPNEPLDLVFEELSTTLVREGLLAKTSIRTEGSFMVAGTERWGPHMLAVASPLGALLFLWAHAVRTSDPTDLTRVQLPDVPRDAKKFAGVKIGPDLAGWRF